LQEKATGMQSSWIFSFKKLILNKLEISFIDGFVLPSEFNMKSVIVNNKIDALLLLNYIDISTQCFVAVSGNLIPTLT